MANIEASTAFPGLFQNVLILIPKWPEAQIMLKTFVKFIMFICFRFWWQFTLAIQCLYSISSTPGYRLFFFSSSCRICSLVDRPLPPPAVCTQGRPEFGRKRFHYCFASFFQSTCSPSLAPSGFFLVTGLTSIQRHRAGLKHKDEKDWLATSLQFPDYSVSCLF